MSKTNKDENAPVPAEELQELFQNVPDVCIDDDGSIHYCPVVKDGQPISPVCRRQAAIRATRRDVPDTASCSTPSNKLAERRIRLPEKSAMEETFKKMKSVKIDDASTIFFNGKL